MTALIVTCFCIAQTGSPLTAAAVSPDQKSLVVGSQRGLFVCHDLADSSAKPRLRPVKIDQLPRAIHDIAFHPGGDRVAVVGGQPAQTGQVIVLAWPSCEVLSSAEVGTDVLFAAEWLNESLLVGSLDGACRVLSPDGLIQAELVGHSKGVTSLQVVGDLIVTGSIDATLRVWDAKSHALVRTLSQHAREVVAMAVRPQNEGPVVLASASRDRTIRFWQPQIGRMVRFARLPSVPLALVWATNQHVAVACHDGRVRIVDYETVEIVREYPVSDLPLHSLTLRGETLFAGQADGHVAGLVVSQ